MWTRCYPGDREGFFDVPVLVTCGVCRGINWTHRLGCLRCIAEVADRMLRAEKLMKELGVEETPEQQCFELAKAYKGEAAAHWRAVADRITFLRAKQWASMK